MAADEVSPRAYAPILSSSTVWLCSARKGYLFVFVVYERVGKFTDLVCLRATRYCNGPLRVTEIPVTLKEIAAKSKNPTVFEVQRRCNFCSRYTGGVPF